MSKIIDISGQRFGKKHDKEIDFVIS